MLHHITFTENPNKTAFGYEQYLPSLKGKTIEFKPGLNVVIGKNGCGKTSLLNVIRKLTFCDGNFSSDISRGHGEWELHRKQNFESGYWYDVKLVGDYKRSVWNLRKNEDVESYDFCASAENMSQFLGSRTRSYGQNAHQAIARMMCYLFYGYDDTMAKDIEKGKESRDFKKSVLDVIDKRMEAMKRCGESDSWYKMWKTMKQYYIDNAIDVTSKDSKMKEYNGFTILLDEPDKGMDVFNVGELYDYLMNNRKPEAKCQMICVLHNIGIIHRLNQNGGVNFIELSNGYLNEVERFFS